MCSKQHEQNITCIHAEFKDKTPNTCINSLYWVWNGYVLQLKLPKSMQLYTCTWYKKLSAKSIEEFLFYLTKFCLKFVTQRTQNCIPNVDSFPYQVHSGHYSNLCKSLPKESCWLNLILSIDPLMTPLFFFPTCRTYLGHNDCRLNHITMTTWTIMSTQSHCNQFHWNIWFFVAFLLFPEHAEDVSCTTFEK